MDNFSEYPPSIGERRADKAHDAALWSPRDALVALLRDIDKGVVNPDALVVVYRWKGDDGDLRSGFYAATSDVHVTIGLLSEAANKFSAGIGS
jgi:hypothetical protein